MKPPNYLRNIILAFVLFFIAQLLVRYLGNYGTWVIIGGVILYYVIWWRKYQAGKNKDGE